MQCVKCKQPILPKTARVYGWTKRGEIRNAHAECVAFMHSFNRIAFTNYVNPAALDVLRASR